MIFCSINEIKNYEHLSRNFSSAIDFILNSNLNELPLGKIEIDGINSKRNPQAKPVVRRSVLHG